MKPGVLAIALALVCGAMAFSPSRALAAVEDDLRDGDKFFDEGDWGRAAAAFDRAINKAPGQVPAEAYGKRAAVFIIQKNYKGALEFLAKAKAFYPAATEILEQEALILWETERRDQAIKVAETVVATRPQAFTNQKLIGEYYAQRDPTKTVTAYEAYLANRPVELEAGDVLPRIRLGFAYLANARGVLAAGDDQRAKGFYQKAADQFDLVQRKFKKPNAQINADNGSCAAYAGLGRFDQAVTVCERVVADPKRIDATGAVWFNLATAYLARRQTKKARTAAIEFTRIRKTEARGFILVGDTYFADRAWPAALEQYLHADRLQPSQRDQVQLSIRLGKTYRRMPVTAAVGGGTAGKTNPNLELAIEKLAGALATNPKSYELAVELGGAYVEAHQDAKATTLMDRLVADSEWQKAPVEQRVTILALAGKAQFNQHKLREARQRFEAAQQLRPTDITIQRDLVHVINEQAFESSKDSKAAQALLEQALAIDAASPATITNLAILAIARGDCEAGQRQLVKLEAIRGHDSVLRLRLLARTHLCLAKPDPKKASEVFAAAEKEAKKANAALALAEIYTEWAPLLWDTNLNDAIDKLDFAVQTGAADAIVAPAARRNLALALYRRGWRLMKETKAVEAALDFDRAIRDPSILKGTEPLAFEFSFALAQLDAGRTNEAAKLFRSLAGKANQGAYLKPQYARVGPQLFAAYASYRAGTLVARQQAAADLARLQDLPGEKLEKVKELLAAVHESIAFEQWRSGQLPAAQRSLATAEKYAANYPEMKRRITMDRLALSLGKADLAALEGLAGTPAETLVNLGIVYDQLGRPKDAHDAWVRAKAKGVQSRDLQKWIDAKKRIYGY